MACCRDGCFFVALPAAGGYNHSWVPAGTDVAKPGHDAATLAPLVPGPGQPETFSRSVPETGDVVTCSSPTPGAGAFAPSPWWADRWRIDYTRSGAVMLATRRAENRLIYLIQPKFPPSYWGLDYFLPLTPFRGI